MNNDNNAMSMQKAHIAKLANKAMSKNQREKKLNHAVVFKEAYPDYTVSEFIDDVLVIGADGLIEAFGSMDVYTQQSVVKILEEICNYSDMIEESELLLAEDLVTERVRSYKDLVATREMLKKKKSVATREMFKKKRSGDKEGYMRDRDREGYMKDREDFVKADRGYMKKAPIITNPDGTLKVDVIRPSLGYAYGRAGIRNFLSGNRIPDRRGVEAATQKFLDSSAGEKWQSIKNVMKKAVSHAGRFVAGAAREAIGSTRAALTRSKPSDSPSPKPSADSPSSAKKENPKLNNGGGGGGEIKAKNTENKSKRTSVADRIEGKKGSANDNIHALRGIPMTPGVPGSTSRRALPGTPQSSVKALPDKKSAKVKPPKSSKPEKEKAESKAAAAAPTPKVTVNVNTTAPGDKPKTTKQAVADITGEKGKVSVAAAAKKTSSTGSGSAGAELWKKMREENAKKTPRKPLREIE